MLDNDSLSDSHNDHFALPIGSFSDQKEIVDLVGCFFLMFLQNMPINS